MAQPMAKDDGEAEKERSGSPAASADKPSGTKNPLKLVLYVFVIPFIILIVLGFLLSK